MADHQRRVYDTILEMLSDEKNPTPILRLNKVVPFKHAKVYAKLEWYNPFGAVKDRVAANMLRDAEEKGIIGDNQKLVEPTSGNTGMGLAMMANAKGYTLSTPLSKAIPAEKRTMLRFFGSDVEELDDTLCPAPGAPEGAIARALEKAERPEFHMLNQYENEANLEAHIRTTGPEIWRQTDGAVTHFVAGLGTCGTITGNGRFLKGKNPDIKVFGVHPDPGHDIPGVRSLPQLKQTKLFHPEEYDQLVEVTNREAFDMCLRLTREESLIAGPSSAMALIGALRLLPDEPGVLAVVIFPDNAFKYASSFERYFPQFRAAPSAGAPGAEPSPKERQMNTLVENSRNPHNTLAVEELQAELQNSRPLVVDVRSPEAYTRQHVAGAVNIPAESLKDRKADLPQDLEAPIVTVCTRGNASISGMLVLQSLGYRNVKSLNGGTTAWAAKGLPVE
jgi:cysteine synthase/rhodanese-related sulfurtransferase